ncbi:MAG: Bug family tripartite tricarboxylate transporter substrate binding protein [Betaproteobacteria bacterium]
MKPAATPQATAHSTNPSGPTPTAGPQRRQVLLGLASAVWAPGLAVAQGSDYPNRAINLVVGYPPGGSTDLTGRVVGAELAKQLGVQVVVENIGGAGGVLGAQKVVQAAADGYTLLLGANNETAIAPLVNRKLRLNPLRDLTGLGLIASQPMVLVASAGNRDAPRSTAEFIQKVKRNPGRFSYGSSGVGTALHLAGEMTKEAAGLFMVHIPYRGVAPLTTDLLSGQLDFGVFVLSSALPHIRSGKMIPIGTTQARRAGLTPEIPALAEHPTLKAVDISSWFGLFGPAALSAPVVQRLQRALADALQVPDVRKRLEESGATMAPAGVNFGAFHSAEIEKYRRIVEYAKIEE